MSNGNSRATRRSPETHDLGGRVNDGVPSNSEREGAPQGGRAFRCASTTSTPLAFRARRILIGSIAVPSYSPGTGNDVTSRMRIAGLLPVTGRRGLSIVSPMMAGEPQFRG